MSNTLLYAFIGFFSILSLGLAFFVWKLLTQIKQKKLKREAEVQVHAEQAQQQKNYLIDSIRIISRSMLDGQCPMTEGCIRLKVLIDNYSPQLHQLPELQVVEMVYAKTSHIPMLDDWKRLSSKERMSFQQEIDLLEKQYSNEIQHAMKFLKEYPFEQWTH